MSVTSPELSYSGPLLPYVAAPPSPVRAAIVLVWVKLAVAVLAAILSDLPAASDAFVVGALTVGLLVAALVSAAAMVVVVVFLRRSHRRVRVVALVFAALSVVPGPDLAAPIPLQVVSGGCAPRCR